MADPMQTFQQGAKKIPKWGWLVIIGGALAVGFIMRRRSQQAAQSVTSADPSQTGGQTPDSALGQTQPYDPTSDPYYQALMNAQQGLGSNLPGAQGADMSGSTNVGPQQTGRPIQLNIHAFTGGGPPTKPKSNGHLAPTPHWETHPPSHGQPVIKTRTDHGKKEWYFRPWIMNNKKKAKANA